MVCCSRQFNGGIKYYVLHLKPQVFSIDYILFSFCPPPWYLVFYEVCCFILWNHWNNFMFMLQTFIGFFNQYFSANKNVYISKKSLEKLCNLLLKLTSCCHCKRLKRNQEHYIYNKQKSKGKFDVFDNVSVFNETSMFSMKHQCCTTMKTTKHHYFIIWHFLIVFFFRWWSFFR